MSSDNFTEWTKLSGGSSWDSGRALTTGSDGSIYIAGYTYGDLDDQTNNGSTDAFISKISAFGEKQWTKFLGTSSNEYSYALTTGSDGSIYIAGQTSGDLDDQTNNGSTDAFISKYNPDGAKDWTRLLGTSSNEYSYALTTGSDGSIYIAGQTSGDLDGQTNSGDEDAFISKYNPDGTKNWTRLIGGSSWDSGRALTTGSDGSIYIAGETRGDLDGQTFQGGISDAFITKYNPDGTTNWTKLLGTGTYDIGYSLTTGSDGSIYIAGETQGNLDGQTNNGNSDAFISKYNPDGTKDWTRLIGTGTYEVGYSLTTGTDGSIYISGYTLGYLDGQTNSQFQSSNIYDEAFISKFNPDGIKVWTRLLGTSSYDYGYALTTGNYGSSYGTIYIAGDTRGDLDGQTNNGSNDAFISKYRSLSVPSDIVISATSFDESTAISGSSYLDSVIATLSTTDEDFSDTHTYEFVREIDSSRFTIEGNQLKPDNYYNYEHGSSYDILIKTTDSGGFSYEKEFTLNVNDINEVATDITTSATSFNENISASITVATLSTTDEDASDTHTYSFVSGTGDTDNHLFTIEGSDLKINSSPDYETQSSYSIRLKTTDNGGLSYAEKLTFTVNDVNEVATDITLSATSFDENISASSTVATLSTADEDASDTHTYSLVSGTGDTDNASFTIEGSDLKINSSPDYETQSSYSIRLKTIDDGGFSYEESFTLNVNDLITGPPTDITLSATSFNENISASSTVATLSTTDEDASDTHTYSLVDDRYFVYDNHKFTIAGNELKIVTHPNYEYESSYNIRLKTTTVNVTGSDSGGLSYEETITLNVNDLIDEKPTDITLSATSFNENISASSTVATLSTADEDASDTHTYSLVSGTGDTDNASFTIEGSDLKINSSPDYETQSSYNILIKTSDSGGLYYEEAFTLNVNDVNQVANDISLSNSSFNENIYLSSIVATLSTTDKDSSDTHTYSLVSGTGDTDNNLFSIIGSNLKIYASSDYETKSSYSVRIKTTDSGGLSYEEAITLSVNDVNEAATDISLSSTSFNENINSGSVVATLSTTDEDESDTHTYELVSGDGDTDNSSFTIEGSNLKINSSPDYETQSSYSILLKTTDIGGLSHEKAITLSVSDLIDTGTLIADINENYSQHSKGFSSISGSAPVTVTAYEVGTETTLDSIKDYDGNLHAGDTLDATASSYKYQGMLDVNGDGVFETIFTNKSSKRWVTGSVDSITGQIDFSDHGQGGTTRVVGIYIDPLVTSGEVEQFGPHDSQRRFQNDLKIDNLIAKHSGDYDSDGIHEVYWKTNDGTAYLRSLMHADGNIRYANYQSESQMSEYLTDQGHAEIISDIV